MKTSESENVIWYREPWFWMLMSPLMLVVVVTGVLISLALSGSDDVVSDNYYKEGRMLSQEFTSEEYAKSIGLAGSVTLDLTTHEALVKLNQSVTTQELHLYLSHPVRADLDVRFPLKKINSMQYRGDLPASIEGRWYIRLTAVDPSKKIDNTTLNTSNEVWRLVGEIDLRQQSHVNLK